MRPIDADALEFDTEWSEYMDGFTSYSQFQIDNAPTIEAEPVRHCGLGQSRDDFRFYEELAAEAWNRRNDNG